MLFYDGTAVGAMFLASKPMFFSHYCDVAWHRSSFFVSESHGSQFYIFA